MNLRTPFDMFVQNFHTNQKACKEYGKDYTFESFFGLFIIDQHTLLEEGKLGGKHQSHFLKVNGNSNHKERGQFDTPVQRPGYLNQNPKGKKDAPHQSRKKKTCQYRGKIGHVEKVCYKKRDDLEEKVKDLEGDVFVVHWPANNYTFQVETSQALLSHFSHKE